ncbi:MAG: hypothetical protein IH996_06950 [Proteobacteria bacterium]|nr:hypothetical protein [Pseudomonadota bacterium]
MSNFDKSIAKALGEEPEIGEFGDEQNILEQVTSSFRSRNRWLVVFGIVFGLVFMGLGIYSLLQFLELKETVQALPWAVLLIFSLVAIIAMKIWYWMELNKNAILREIVRLERRIEQLHEALSER